MPVNEMPHVEMPVGEMSIDNLSGDQQSEHPLSGSFEQSPLQIWEPI